MNRNSIQEYIYWLERFGEIYKKYIDSSKELNEIFAGTLEKFQRILRENIVNTEENIIKSLKELVRKFSAAYDANRNINKTLEGPRSTDAFKQAIYKNEIAELKKWLMENINNTELFSNFESIVMYVAKKRQMIEFLKLGLIKSNLQNYQNINKYNFYFDIFGKKRGLNDNMISPLFGSHAKHLFDEFINKKITLIQHKYNYLGEEIPLTIYSGMWVGTPKWEHTNVSFHPILFEIMNKLYSEFLSNRNNISQKNKLAELYWLYMQTCPFERGSASIGEILFSVLLRKYFNCDFFISNGWNGNPEIIPDIHALMYDLERFKKIFLDQFTNCTGKLNPNINNVTANQLRRKVIATRKPNLNINNATANRLRAEVIGL